ncbi:outer membrane beta-barrel protein [Paraferrimonas sedimenticola]|uniref:Outer membrane beta-barrel protein n=1 Tax=Paraferrimonas sedimenticola TaxID=375674 RepID=A0AA37RVK9_9GAMM|nr:outer membrane beta-barrel protein [Paraferrimonas sedimenticola]GLP96016.1 hypothetical protein GCM10007895_13220 [Paraferrimonas sedimenticola]
MGAKSFVSGRVALLTALVGASFNVHSAVQPQPYVTDSGVELEPWLKVTGIHDDNLLRSQTNKLSTSGTFIEPGVKVRLNPGSAQFNLGYRLNRGDYYQSKVDNFTDHFGDVGLQWEITRRNRLSLVYDFSKRHEGRGYGFSEGRGELFDKPLTYDRNNAEAIYGFGGVDAAGRLELSVRYRDKKYTNFEEVTQFQNLKEMRYRGTFFYQMAPKTDLLFEIIRNDSRYDVQRPDFLSRDNDDYFGYVGASMTSDSAQVVGDIRLGYQNKRFKQGNRDKFNDFSWDVGLTWNLKTYSRIELSTSQRAKNPNQETGNYVKQTLGRVAWRHAWVERFSSTLEYYHANDDYNGIVRNDKLNQYGVSFEYDMRRWLSFAVGYVHGDKTSNAEGIGFKQNRYTLSVHVTL